MSACAFGACPATLDYVLIITGIAGGMILLLFWLFGVFDKKRKKKVVKNG